MAEQKVKLSFGFTKKVGQRNLQDSKLRDEATKEVKTDPDFVVSLSEKQIESSVPSAAKKSKLVIPLIVKNNWRLPSNTTGSNVKSGAGASVLDTQAIEEIIKDAKRLKDGVNDEDKKTANLIIPVFMQNKIPEGFETDEKIDVALRAEESTLDDYERIPVDEYGAAMLRGMGWKPTEGIGATNKKVIAAPEPVLRPKGLGLGADPKVKMAAKSKNKDENVPDIDVGTFIRVVKGPNEGQYGQIQGMDTDNARVIVKMSLSSNTITISEYLVVAVSKQEYKKEGKILNKAKYEEYKAKSEEAMKKSRSHGDERSRERSSHSHKDDRNDRRPDRDDRNDRRPDREDRNDRRPDREDRNERRPDREERNERRQDREDRNEKRPDREDRSDRRTEREPTSSKRRHSPDTQSSLDKSSQNGVSLSWVRPLLRVRFIDKSYKNGKYYNEKVIIEDVVNDKNCICRTDGGNILEDIPEKWLETLIPRKSPSIVMVVKGEHKSQLGEILEKDKRKCTATVQLLQDKDLVQLDFNSICEYGGKISDYD